MVVAVLQLEAGIELPGCRVPRTTDACAGSTSPVGTVVRLDSTSDVPSAVYEHALACEYAHEASVRMAARDRMRVRAMPTGRRRSSMRR